MLPQNALIVNGSPRKNGNTNWLASLAVDELYKRKIEPKVIAGSMLKSLNNGCIGCQGCQRSKDFLCVFKDEVQPVVASMPSYRYLIFSTPVYFFSPTAQIKLVLDRMFSLIKLTPEGKYVHPFNEETKLGLIVTAGDGLEGGADLTIEAFKRTAEIMGRPFESLFMPNCPMQPSEIENPSEWKEKAADFCDRLIGK